MLGFLFGFNARLSRMRYCLGIIGLAVVSTAVSFAIAGYLFQSSRNGMPPSAGLMTGPMIAAGVVHAWVAFTLQSIRIRDIGWDPVCVIPTWIAIPRSSTSWSRSRFRRGRWAWSITEPSPAGC
jgi:hypothetical protein